MAPETQATSVNRLTGAVSDRIGKQFLDIELSFMLRICNACGINACDSQPASLFQATLSTGGLNCYLMLTHN